MHHIFLGLRSFGTTRIGKLHYVTYTDEHLVKCIIKDCKKGLLPLRFKVAISQDRCPWTSEEKDRVRRYPMILQW